MRAVHLLAAFTALTAPTAAQTTGFPGVNDYTVAGIGSGSTSCTEVMPPPGGGFALTVSASRPGLPVLYALTFAGTTAVVPCAPGAVGLPPSPCILGGPGPPPIQSLDLLVGSGFGLPPFAALTGPGGFATVFAPPLPAAGLGLTIGTQAFVLDPTCGFPFVATQAYLVVL